MDIVLNLIVMDTLDGLILTVLFMVRKVAKKEFSNMNKCVICNEFIREGLVVCPGLSPCLEAYYNLPMSNRPVFKKDFTISFVDDYNFAVQADIIAERRRQEKLKADGVFPHTCAENAISNFEKLAILGEEFGEVCRASMEITGINTKGDEHRDLYKELVQVAAVATAWAESLLKK